VRTADLFQSIYSDLDRGATKLKTLGKGAKEEDQLPLDSAESMARYAQILRPNVLAAIRANRGKGRTIIACLIALFALAGFLAFYGNVHGLAYLTAMSIPGLGVAAWWPIAVLVRLRREDVALQLLPDLLPLLAPKDAAEVVKKMLLLALTPSDAGGKPSPVPGTTAVLCCLALLGGSALPVRAQEGRPVEARPEAEARDEALRKLHDPAMAEKIRRVQDLFNRADIPVVKGTSLRDAAQKGKWDDPGARVTAVSLLRDLGKNEDAGSRDLTRQARAFLNLGNEILFKRAEHSYAQGDVKDAAAGYEELLADPGLAWDTRPRAEEAFRDTSYKLGVNSYRAQDWDQAAAALSNYVDQSPAGDLRNRESFEMLADALMKAGVSDYAKHEWFSASLSFGKLVENSRRHTAVRPLRLTNSVWSEFHEYVRSIPGMREQAAFYQARENHLAEVENMPGEIAVIDVIANSSPASTWAAAGGKHPYTFHAFANGGALDAVVSGANLQEAVASLEFRALKANSPAISAVVVTGAAKEALAGPVTMQSLFPGKIVWHTDSTREAAENLAELKAAHPKIDDFSVAMLLPKNEDQKQKLGLQHWSREDQQRTWESAQNFLDQSGIRDILTERVNRGGVTGWLYDWYGDSKTQERLFEALAQKKNVLIFIAHGDRQHLYSPDGSSIAVSDIQKLQLQGNRPTVFLFSCEGGKAGKSDSGPTLADALKQAGAGSVWSFEEKIDAGEALSAASALLDEVKRGRSMLDAIQTLALTLRKLGSPRIYLKTQLRPLMVPTRDWPLHSATVPS
jgi:hypothetical protein